MAHAVEVNFDGIIGPTHNYSGLAYGNTASMEHEKRVSNPKMAALQGLAKMHTLFSLGIKQAVLPPQERPSIAILHALGFYGTDEEILHKAWTADPKLVFACGSAACMWAANAATISPSADSNDMRVHFTPANLLSQFHRSFECPMTGMFLRSIFDHPAYFAHHHPLPFHADFADEGAANHTRFCHTVGQPGVQLFVYGRKETSPKSALLPKRFPARQSEEASRALARLHRLTPSRVVFAQQNPDAIDSGVFHNDVISVGNQNVFVFHEKAFLNTAEVILNLKNAFEKLCQHPFVAIEVKENAVSLAEAVKTYLFNSQLVTLPDASMALIAPDECRSSSSAKAFLDQLLTDHTQPIRQVIYQNVRESMQNGGGPACLRLRVVLNQTEFNAMHQEVILTEHLYQLLVDWVNKHYRDHLTPEDLHDPHLLQEGRQALDELTRILHLGSIYPFQRQGPAPRLPDIRS